MTSTETAPEAVQTLLVRADETPAPEAILSFRENALYRALKTEKRRKDWLAGRWAAKTLLARMLEVEDMREIEVLPDREGRPQPRAAGGMGAGWTLTITHSGAFAAAAVDALGGPVGLDLETVEERDPAIIPVAFHPSELGAALDPSTLTRMWTVKEAVLKFLGLGLTCDLTEVRVSPRLTLHGKALERHRALGSPEILLDSRLTAGGWLTLARTGGEQ